MTTADQHARQPVRSDPEDTETAALHALIDFTGRRVLEIGCGDGRLTWRYADRAASVVAIDPDAAEIATAREDCPPALRNRIEFRATRLEDFIPPAEKFDLAFLAWSL
jgi:2-polyprenyl-3-methyl-5-hydroxy-6-metoxy-1,4-benzoquinol methylase